MNRNVPYGRAYTYNVTTPPSQLAVTLELFKQHLKKRNSDSGEDVLLNLYLNAAISYAESFTRRDLITRTYQTFRDYFPSYYGHEGYYQHGIVPGSIGTGINPNVGFEIRRSPMKSVVQIQYYIEGVLTLLDSAIYYNTLEEDYSEILAVNDWPRDCDSRLQAIQIDFTCGIADTPENVPPGFTEAILAHATSIRQSRGDCSANGCAKALPAISKAFYLQNRIENL